MTATFLAAIKRADLAILILAGAMLVLAFSEDESEISDRALQVLRRLPQVTIDSQYLHDARAIISEMNTEVSGAQHILQTLLNEDLDSSQVGYEFRGMYDQLFPYANAVAYADGETVEGALGVLQSLSLALRYYPHRDTIAQVFRRKHVRCARCSFTDIEIIANVGDYRLRFSRIDSTGRATPFRFEHAPRDPVLWNLQQQLLERMSASSATLLGTWRFDPHRESPTALAPVLDSLSMGAFDAQLAPVWNAIRHTSMEGAIQDLELRKQNASRRLSAFGLVIDKSLALVLAPLLMLMLSLNLMSFLFAASKYAAPMAGDAMWPAWPPLFQGRMGFCHALAVLFLIPAGGALSLTLRIATGADVALPSMAAVCVLDVLIFVVGMLNFRFASRLRLHWVQKGQSEYAVAAPPSTGDIDHHEGAPHRKHSEADPV